MELLLKKEDVIISTLDDLPVDKAKGEREWNDRYGFRSLLFVPMISQTGLYGTPGFYSRIGQNFYWSTNEGFVVSICDNGK